MKKIVLAAVSARPYVAAAAAAGYDVIAIDMFADADTQRHALGVHTLPYGNGRFDEEAFERIIRQIPQQDMCGFAYGSGFEAMPDLLEMVSQRFPLIGNLPKVVRNIKRPRQFFYILSTLNIPFPEVSFEPLGDVSGWLYKQGGGSGGTHIRKALPLPEIFPQPGSYFQREINDGRAVSLLFAADGYHAKPIGFNEQWLAPLDLMPYRYGGAVSHAQVLPHIAESLILAAQKITNAVGLRGINSLDAIVSGEHYWVLEINPRLSASFDFYHSETSNMFKVHMDACAGNIQNLPSLPKYSKAHHIVYAKREMAISGLVKWPKWVADVPRADTFISPDYPVCTIFAEGATPQEARGNLKVRVEEIEEMIKQFSRQTT